MAMGLYERVVVATCGPGRPQPLAVDWFSPRVRVHTDDATTRDYVASQHHTLQSRSAAGHVDLYAVADPGLLDHVRDTVTGPVRGRREAFRGEWYALRRSPAGEEVLLTEDGHNSPHALVTTDFRSFALIGRSPAAVRLVITRTVRELVREDLLARGAMMFHGAAARHADGHGVLLVGAASTGKTSSAIRIAQGGGRVVGTDRVLVLRHGGRWTVVGLPMSTRLGAGAVRALGLVDVLRERAPIRAINPFRRAAVEAPTETTSRYGLDKVWLSNAEIHELLGVGFASATTVDSIVVLAGAVDGEPRVEPLTPDEAAAELAAHLMAPDPDFRSRWLAADPTPESPRDVRRPLENLVRDRAASRVVWDPARHCDERTPALLRVGATA